MAVLNKNIDIIILALARWDGNYASTAFALAKELAKSNRVFYVDNPFTVSDYLRNPTADYFTNRKESLLFGNNVVKELDTNFFTVCPKLMLPINWLSEGLAYRQLSKLNDRSLSKTIEKVVKENNIKNFVFINSFNPFYNVHFSEAVKPLLTVYQSVDNIEFSKYIDKHGPRLETEIISNSDITIVTSTHLKKKKSVDNNKPVFLVPNAADFSLFNKASNNIISKPIDLQSVKSKIIGYIGNLDQRVDINLLKALAKKKPTITIVLVGPVDKKMQKDFDELRKLNNVLFTGKQVYEKLPNYLAHFDCCIIPFKVNALTACIYPLKINEYLAAGKPVVSTAFSEDIKAFDSVIEIAYDQVDFLSKVDNTLKESSEAQKLKRIESAKNNTWKNRTSLLKSIIAESITSKVD